MAANRPDVWFGLALNADPNDPRVSPVWTDFTSSLRKVTALERGRNFELDTSMASDPSVLIRDVDELLNPANLSSPHVNLVQPYRPACLLAQWPNTPVGGAVNLFNSGAWRGNKEDVYDGSFEAFTSGVRPSWALPVPIFGGPTVTVGTSTPFQGSKRLGWTVASTTTQQGFSWPVACIPGRQYTCSVYVNQTTASTQRISVTDQVVGADPFNLTGSNGWGTDRLGHAWSALVGASSVFSYANLYATIAVETTAADRIISQDTGALDHTTFVRLIAPDPATVGATSANSGVAVRVSDASNYINPIVVWRADGTVGVATYKRVGGVRSNIVAEVATGWAYTAGQEFILRVDTQTLGTTANVNSVVWPATKPVPTAAYNNTATATDAALLGGTRVGCSGRIESLSGITLPYSLRFAAFNVTGYAHGSTTATTGAYVRLSVTWTATEPKHTVQLATTGTAVAGTVLADAVQHEQAAAASTYTTAGPVIYPVMRSYIEQFPRIWSSAGYEGFVEAPCVDALAVLNATTIETEYSQVLLNLGPDYYWRLNDGTQTQLFADTSGNGGPALVRAVSKYGAGTDPEPGTAIAIPGDAGATGVAFTPTGSSAGTIIGIGPDLGLPSSGVRVPPVLGVTWSFTISAWVALTDFGGANQMIARVIKGGVFATPQNFSLALQLAGTTQAQIGIVNGSNSATGVLAGNFVDGKLHHVVGVITQDATNTSLTCYVDGVAGTTNTVSTASVGGLTANQAVTAMVGGSFSATQFGAIAQGTIGHVAMWNRALSASDVSQLYSAGVPGYNGETSGGRVLRHLQYGGYNGPTRITQDSGGVQTLLQPPTWTGTKDLLTDSQENTGAEQGTFWAAPDGAVVFESRQDRWLRLTPAFVLGENTAGGEVPYMMDTARFVADPLYVYADVQIGRNNGVTARGGTVQDSMIAARRYFPRSATGSFDFYTDDLAQYAADWIFNTHDAPMIRVDELVIDPASNPTLWPFALGAEIGQRGTVKRRAKAANSGAGITMSADYFIEKIATDAIDFETGEWSYRIQLSPINAGGQPTMQPWILEDATYGVLDLTTVLGF